MVKSAQVTGEQPSHRRNNRILQARSAFDLAHEVLDEVLLNVRILLKFLPLLIRQLLRLRAGFGKVGIRPEYAASCFLQQRFQQWTGGHVPAVRTSSLWAMREFLI